MALVSLDDDLHDASHGDFALNCLKIEGVINSTYSKSIYEKSVMAGNNQKHILSGRVGELCHVTKHQPIYFKAQLHDLMLSKGQKDNLYI